jgi:transposase
VAVPVPGRRRQGAFGHAPAGPAQDGGPGRDRGRDAGSPAAAARGDALVVPAAGPRAGRLLGERRRYLARDLQPWRRESFRFSTDPQLEAKLTDVVGLYLNPPENAVVVCVDEKSRVQALDRTQPILPLRPGLPEKATHDYIRHGTTTLFAALEIATGQVTDACYPRHRHQEFLRFLKKIAAAYPDRELHVVCDNYATHKHPEVRKWLAANPRVTLHFTPAGCSWLNMAEIFFSIITRQAIRRGTYTSVKDLIAKIGTFIDGWNDRCQPFVWTKPADELLAKIKRKETSRSGH